MGLYLCVFDGDEELDGVEVGSYEDWGLFVQTVTAKLEGGRPGSRFPTLILHSDCDGEWSTSDCGDLLLDLDQISRSFLAMPPVLLPDGWKQELAKQLGLRPTNLGECFFDVDGEPLVDRLRELARLAQRVDKPILFQ